MNYNRGALLLNVFRKISWTQSVLYDIKSKLPETWCNGIASDTKSIPNAWSDILLMDSVVKQPVDIFWIRLAGSNSWAKHRSFTLLWNGGCGSLSCILTALRCWWCTWVCLFCLMGHWQFWAFVVFWIGNERWKCSVTCNMHMSTD